MGLQRVPGECETTCEEMSCKGLEISLAIGVAAGGAATNMLRILEGIYSRKLGITLFYFLLYNGYSW